MTEHDRDVLDGDPLLEELASLRPAPVEPAVRARLARRLTPRRATPDRSISQGLGVAAAVVACLLVALAMWIASRPRTPDQPEVAGPPSRPEEVDSGPRGASRLVPASMWSYRRAATSSTAEFESVLGHDADRLLPNVEADGPERDLRPDNP